MATVTGLTAERMAAIEDASVVDGDVVADHLILTRHDGTQIDAGNVKGDVGLQGPAGTNLPVINAVPILDVGVAGQIRAGRQLGPTDFTNLGLSAPLGLWNLSDLSDVSGNGRNLLNKGAVPFDRGINGFANSAAKFSGSLAQALYSADTGVNDPLRIRMGSVGCWFRSAKRSGTNQPLITKVSAAAGNYSWQLFINGANQLAGQGSTDGTAVVHVTGTTDVVDDRWHFVVVVYSGPLMLLYLDGILEATAVLSTTGSMLFAGTAPFNIGANNADAGANSSQGFFGRVDEAFVTGDILSEEEIRNLYCAKIPHTLAAIPSRVALNIHRRRRGVALVSGDFPAQPVRLYNFTGGALTDLGSGNVALTNNNAAKSVPGADGTKDGAFNFTISSSQSLSSTDAGLPSGLNLRSYGAWFKTSVSATGSNQIIMAWGGAGNVAECRISVFEGKLFCTNGNDTMPAGGTPAFNFVADGLWHQVVVIEDNGAADGIKRKLYLDGKLVAVSTVMNSVTLTGADRFRIGCMQDNSGVYFQGQIDGVFVCAYALTFEQMIAIFAKGTQDLGRSPKNEGDHIEAMTATDLLCTFDMLDVQHTVDLGVMA